MSGFRNLLTIRFRHEYFNDGLCRQLRLTPTSETKKILKGHRHLLKDSETGGTIGYERSEEGGPFIKLAPGTVLAFQLWLIDPSFLSITHLQDKSAKELYQFLSTDASQTGESEENFRYDLPAATAAIVASQDKSMRPLGIFKLTIDDTIHYTKPVILDISFVPRETVWKYKIILSKDYTNCQFKLEDQENYQSNNANSKYEKISFAETSEQDYSRGSVVVFQTGKVVDEVFVPQQVPYYERPKKDLELKINGPEKVKINHLPVPSPNHLKSEVYINV